MSSAVVEQRLRWMMLALAGLIFLVTPVELWLKEHTANAVQIIPFVLCALGFLAVLAALLAPQKNTLRGLRIIMIVTVAGSLFGIVEHIEHNLAFELEIRPNAQASDVFMDALMGANPLLAPGMLAFGALVALLATYYHPRLKLRDLT